MCTKDKSSRQRADKVTRKNIHSMSLSSKITNELQVLVLIFKSSICLLQQLPLESAQHDMVFKKTEREREREKDGSDHILN